MICAEFRSSHRGLLFSIRHSRDPRRPSNLSNSTCRVYTSTPLPSPTGPSRATAGPGETFLRGPKHFYGAPLGRKFLNFSFQNGTFWRTSCFWPTAGPLNVAGPGIAYPLYPTLSTGLITEAIQTAIKSRHLHIPYTPDHSGQHQTNNCNQTPRFAPTLNDNLIIAWSRHS